MADQSAQDRNMVPDSRAEFEAWADSRKPRSLRSSVTDDYNYPLGNLAFEVWQAATQRQQERIAYVEKIADDAIELGNQQAIRIAELEAQVQALRLDAGRYRYLRSHCLCAGHGSITVFLDDRHGTGNRARPLHLEEMDTAINAAIAAGKGDV